MRSFHCPPNYSLSEIKPNLVDPDVAVGAGEKPGTCIFRTEIQTDLPGSYPAAPAATYMSRVEGTFCPPFYKSSLLECNLVADSIRNSDPIYGRGKCGVEMEKDCSRTVSETRTWEDPAYTAWAASTDPWCPPAIAGDPCKPLIGPPRWVTGTWCSHSAFSPTCNGVDSMPDSCGSCSPVWGTSGCSASTGAWAGVKYAASITDTFPSAEPVKTASGRQFTCSFDDTSPPCTAPDIDIHGHHYGKKTAVWYGGVYVSGGKCEYDASQNPDFSGAEIIDATLGP